MKALLRVLLAIAAPFLFVFGGAGLIGFGIDHDVRFLVWTGGVLVLSGLVWGLFMWLFDTVTPFSFFDGDD